MFYSNFLTFVIFFCSIFFVFQIRREIIKISAPFNEKTLIGRNLVGIEIREENSGISRELKVFTLVIQIKRLRKFYE